MAKLKEHDIKDFQVIYEKETGIKLSKKDADNFASTLIKMTRGVLSLNSEKNENKG